MLKIDGVKVSKPAITKYGFSDLGDDPASHRWRAWWAYSFDGEVRGIALCAYPVIKVNPQSVWISQDSLRCGKNWKTYDPKWMRKKLCHNGSGSAWAKPTQDEAIHSLAVRLTRWASILSNNVEKAISAAHVLEKLRPDKEWAAQHTIEKLEGKNQWPTHTE